MPQHHDKHHFIDKDWRGLKSPIDAVMTGRMYVPSWRPTQQHDGHPFDQQQNQQSQQNQEYQQYQHYRQQYQQYQQYGQQWGRRRQSRSPNWGSMAERGMNIGQEMAERGMKMGLRLAEKRMEMEEKLGHQWGRRWDQDWDQDRRRDSYGQNNRGNHDSRRDRLDWDSFQGEQLIQTVYFFKGGNSKSQCGLGSQ